MRSVRGCTEKLIRIGYISLYSIFGANILAPLAYDIFGLRITLLSVNAPSLLFWLRIFLAERFLDSLDLTEIIIASIKFRT